MATPNDQTGKPGREITDDDRKKSEAASDTFRQILSNNPAFKSFLEMMGFNEKPLNPAQLALRSETNSMLRDTFLVDAKDQAMGLKVNDGTGATMLQNFNLIFDKKIADGTIVFSADKGQNDAAIAAVKADVSKIAAEADGRINFDYVLQEITTAIEKQQPKIVQQEKTDVPKLQGKAEPAGIDYGPSVKIDPAKVPFAKELDVNGMDAQGNFEPIGKIDSGRLLKTLGDEVSISRVVSDGDNIGYYVAGKDGGYFVGPQAIDTEKAVAEMGPTMKAIMAPVPEELKPSGPVPAMVLGVTAPKQQPDMSPG